MVALEVLVAAAALLLTPLPVPQVVAEPFTGTGLRAPQVKVFQVVTPLQPQLPAKDLPVVVVECLVQVALPLIPALKPVRVARVGQEPTPQQPET